MSNYESTHTGAQIDKAISEVLNGNFAPASDLSVLAQTVEDEVDRLSRRITENASAIALKADKTTVDALAQELDSANQLIAVAKKQAFIDLWLDAVGSYGSYDTATGMFSLNGLTDITYAQAVTIYNQTNQFMGAMQGGKYAHCTFRTNIPNRSIYNSASSVSYTYAFRNNTAVEVIKGNYGTSGVTPTTLIDAFYGCTSLRVIDMVFNCNSITTQTNFSNSVFGRCAALEEVRLRNVRVNVDLSACPNISYESLEYLVDNRPSGMTEATAITVYVHADVWDKLNNGDASGGKWNGLRVRAMGGPYYVNFALKTA